MIKLCFPPDNVAKTNEFCWKWVNSSSVFFNLIGFHKECEDHDFDFHRKTDWKAAWTELIQVSLKELHLHQILWSCHIHIVTFAIIIFWKTATAHSRWFPVPNIYGLAIQISFLSTVLTVNLVCRSIVFPKCFALHQIKITSIALFLIDFSSNHTFWFILAKMIGGGSVRFLVTKISTEYHQNWE